MSQDERMIEVKCLCVVFRKMQFASVQLGTNNGWDPITNETIVWTSEILPLLKLVFAFEVWGWGEEAPKQPQTSEEEFSLGLQQGKEKVNYHSMPALIQLL